MNRRKFIGGCACCAFLGTGAVYLNKNNIFSKDSDQDYKDIQHYAIHLTNYCNLNCKYCNHFSSIAPKDFYNLDKFKQDVKRLSYILDGRLIKLHLLGGEPLLNPKINEYLEFSRQCFPDMRISINTNAILLNDMDEKFWKTLNKNNISITPSIYPVKINWESIFNKAEKYNIGIYNGFDLKEKLLLSDVDKFRKYNFIKKSFSETKYLNVDKTKCEQRGPVIEMYDGKIYRCCFMAFIEYFNKKFNKNFVVTKQDYVDLHKIENFDSVREFLALPVLPFCRYCSCKFEVVKWETSDEHDISEWT